MRLLFLLVLLLFLLPYPTFAKGSSITVSPQLIKLDLSQDLPEAKYSYTNNTNQTIELSLSMQDVKELEDRGIPGLLDENESKNYKYGLSRWAKFSNNNIVVEPGETKDVTVFIDKTRLTLGGHYASVLAEIKQPEDKKEVNLRAILASLLFVRSGSEFDKEEASINSFVMSQEFFSFPKNASFKLKNVGNVDITPHGILKVYDPFGREVVRAIVNEDSLIALPDSERKYTVVFSPRIVVLPPGIYKAVLQVSYGKKQVKNEAKMSFFSLGSLTVDKLVILTLGGIFVGLLFLKFRRRDNRIK